MGEIHGVVLIIVAYALLIAHVSALIEVKVDVGVEVRGVVSGKVVSILIIHNAILI